MRKKLPEPELSAKWNWLRAESRQAALRQEELPRAESEESARELRNFRQ